MASLPNAACSHWPVADQAGAPVGGRRTDGAVPRPERGGPRPPHPTQPLPRRPRPGWATCRTTHRHPNPGIRHRCPHPPAHRPCNGHHRRLHRHALGRAGRPEPQESRPGAGHHRDPPRAGCTARGRWQAVPRPTEDPDSVREIHLPRFLVDLLQQVAGSHPHPSVFCGACGGYQRRSNFNRRAWTPAASGQPDKNTPPIVAGMHFHDLRHSHKTWLIEDGIPRSPKQDASATASAASAASTATSLPPCSAASPRPCNAVGPPPATTKTPQDDGETDIAA